MEHPRGGENRLGASLFDDFLALVGFFILVYPFIGAFEAHGPVPETVLFAGFVLDSVFLTSLVLALPAAFVYRYTGGTLGNLGSFVLVSVALYLVVGFAAMILLGATDSAPNTGSTASLVMNLSLNSLVYLTAYGAVYRDTLSTGTG
ncbi:MAG: hypothetical protein SV760_06090 [Halobacteria archaeon]|nr:hypothetical protein [Halobacteria archaeon]